MRVSDNTARGAVNEAINTTRSRMQRLEMENATQKRLLRPSDNPAANAKIMDIRTESTINSQFDANATLAQHRLQMTFSALGELYRLFVRAKQIAISQSSDASASADSRLGVAQEVSSLYNQLISVANSRDGEHYIFGGYKTLTAPYTRDGKYHGDGGEIPIEIQKGVYVKVNIPGSKLFDVPLYQPGDRARKLVDEDRRNIGLGGAGKAKQVGARGPASSIRPREIIDAFRTLDGLHVALLTNDTNTIRDSLNPLNAIIKSLITQRAKISARVTGIQSAVRATDRIDQQNKALESRLEDADYTKLWSNMAKQETVLRASLQSAKKLIQPTLLEFLN